MEPAVLQINDRRADGKVAPATHVTARHNLDQRDFQLALLWKSARRERMALIELRMEGVLATREGIFDCMVSTAIPSDAARDVAGATAVAGLGDQPFRCKDIGTDH